MTKTTEELKHAMYKVLSNLDHLTNKAEIGRLQTGESATHEMQLFQSTLEAYLEALRQEIETLKQYNSKGHNASLQDQATLQEFRQECERLGKESIAKDIRIDHLERMGDVLRDGYMYQQGLTSQARAEADRERNRAQAFEFANKSAGEFLQAANEKVKRQRQSIGQLKNDRNNAQSLAAVHYAKYQKARQELAEFRKLASCSESSRNAEKCAHTTDPNGTCIYCRQKMGGVEHAKS